MYIPIRALTTPIILLGMIALMTAPACCAVHHGGTNADLGIAVNELTPQPVCPGRDLILSATIDNRGGGTAEYVTLTIMPDSHSPQKRE